MTFVFVAKLKVGGFPGKKPATCVAMGMLEATPARKALLITVSGACRKEGGMEFFLCPSPDAGTAAHVCLFGVA